MNLTADPKALAAALKAARGFVSPDPTRYVLQNVYVERESDTHVRFTATDGHTLCSVVIAGTTVDTAPVLLAPHAVDVLLAIAKGHKTPGAEFALIPSPIAGTFPDYRRVLPERHEDLEAKADALSRFNGEYLARVGAVQKALKADGVDLQMGDREIALRADMESDLGRATVVVMPQRMGAKWAEKLAAMAKPKVKKAKVA